MWVELDRLGGSLRDAGLSATVVFSVVGLAVLACRQPARRIALARAALACSLTLPLLSALAPWPRIDLWDTLRGPANVPEPAHSPRGPEPATGHTARSFDSRWPGRLLTLGYLGGLGAGFAWVGLGCWGMAWLGRRSRRPSAEARALYESLDWRGGRDRPRFRLSDRVRRPVLIGTWRPTILVPAALDRPETIGALRLGLLHELAHGERGDPGFHLTSRLAQAVWFYLPPVWWVGAQLRLDHEFLADRQAALRFGPTEAYAHSLVNLAATGPGPDDPGPQGPGPPDRGGSSLFPRVLMLVQCPFPVESRPPGWWSWSLPVLVVLATVASSSLCLRGAESSAGPPPRGGTFQLARLVLPAKPGNSHGRAPLFELPLRLPARFALTVDVWGDPVRLSQTRVVGHRLGPPAPVDRSERPRWHRVQVCRDDRGLAVQLDDHPVAIDPEPGTTTTWLSVEAPPDRPARFQDLTLIWTPAAISAGRGTD